MSTVLRAIGAARNNGSIGPIIDIDSDPISMY